MDIALVPALAAVAIFLGLGASEGGFYPIGTDEHQGLGWYPGALLLLALLGAAAVGLPRTLRIPRLVAAAVLLLAAYTAWTYLSIAWAGDGAEAWDGANRTAMYLVAFTLFALWPLGGRSGRVVLGAFGLGIAGLGLVQLLRLGASDEQIRFFIGARLAEPAGYINANVALWMLGSFPCMLLATSREVNPLLRGLFLGGAGLLAGLALLGQSRGWALALPIALVLFVLLAPGRLRAVAAIAAVGVAGFVMSGPALAVHDDFSPARFEALVSDAVTSVLVVALVLAVAGAAAAFADRRAPVAPGSHRRSLAMGALLALVLVVGTGLLLTEGDAPTRVSDAWSDFKHGEAQPEEGTSRFTASGNNRYDFWRVAWQLFEEHPVRGVGIENFQQHYLERGRSLEKPRYPHSLELGVLAQTGLVGALLLGGAVLAALAAALRAARRNASADARGAALVAGGAAAIFLYWLLHASVDWLWEFPGLTAPAFAMLGLAAGLAAREPAPGAAAGRRFPPIRTAGYAAGAVAGLALAASLIVPWLARRDLDRAVLTWQADPVAAFNRLNRSARLNPLSAAPYMAEGSIALQMEDEVRAERALQRALERQPRLPFVLLELGALASERGERQRAESLLRRAVELNHRDQITREALIQVRKGRSLDVRTINELLLTQVRSRSD